MTATTPVLEATGLTAGYDGTAIVHDVDLAVQAGTITTLIGRNGCGKSTLLRTLGRLHPAMAGSLALHGRPFAAYGAKPFARTVASLPQALAAPPGLSVRDLVMRGRNPHQRFTAPWTAADSAVVDRVLAEIGLEGVASRPVQELSGGQRQRAWLGLVLAQEAEVLLLDEPTTFLDLSHQLDVLELVERVGRAGRTVVMVLHDLGLAARCSDRLIAVHDGRLAADGAPADVLTEPLLAEVFGLDARIIPDPVTGSPLVVPIGTLPTPPTGRPHP